MPRLGLENFQAETGTGLAQPNMNATRWMVSNWLIRRNPGSRIVPTRSTWRSGLSDSRPPRARCRRRAPARHSHAPPRAGDREHRRQDRQRKLQDEAVHARRSLRSCVRRAVSRWRRRARASAWHRPAAPWRQARSRAAPRAAPGSARAHRGNKGRCRSRRQAPPGRARAGVPLSASIARSRSSAARESRSGHESCPR